MKTESYNVRFISISLDYVSAGGAVEPVDATWSVSPASVNVEINADETVEITTNYDGTLEVSSDATGVATATINGKIVTVHGVSIGSANITITGAATSNYNAINKQFSVSVVAGERPYTNTINLSSKFSYTYFGTTPEGKNAYAQPDETNRVKTDDILTMTIARNGSSNTKPRYDANCLRFYKGNTLTIAVPSNFKITSVTFVEPSSGTGWDGSMSATSGNYNNTTKKWKASSDVNTITFTGETATNRIGGIIVNVNGPEYAAVTISAAEYATYYNADFAYTMPEGLEGLVVYDIDGASLDIQSAYSAGNVVPACEPLILHGNAGSYILYAGETSDPTLKSGGMNLLSGTSTADEETTGGDVYYRLSKHGDNVGFYWGAADGAPFQPGANKAYLAISSESAPSYFPFNDTEEGIMTGVASTEAVVENGKFIENGQLIIVKDGVRYNSVGQIVR